MDKPKSDEIRNAIRENYGKGAALGEMGCGCSSSSCCGTPNDITTVDQTAHVEETGDAR